jgi:hypothetical protein
MTCEKGKDPSPYGDGNFIKITIGEQDLNRDVPREIVTAWNALVAEAEKKGILEFQRIEVEFPPSAVSPDAKQPGPAATPAP